MENSRDALTHPTDPIRFSKDNKERSSVSVMVDFMVMFDYKGPQSVFRIEKNWEVI